MGGDPQLQRLLTYTVIHVGIYIALFAAMVALFTFRGHTLNTARWVLLTTIALAIAGAAAGIIGSSIPEYQTWSLFAAAKFGPWFFAKLAPYAFWRSLEHSAFWVGAVLAFVAMLICDPQQAGGGTTAKASE